MKYLLALYMLTNHGEAYIPVAPGFDTLASCEVAANLLQRQRPIWFKGTRLLPDSEETGIPSCILVAAVLSTDDTNWE